MALETITQTLKRTYERVDEVIGDAGRAAYIKLQNLAPQPVAAGNNGYNFSARARNNPRWLSIAKPAVNCA